MKNHVELVLTLPNALGPEMAHLARARTTLGALTQMVAQSQEEIMIAAPYIREDILSESTLQVALQHAVQDRRLELNIITTGDSINRFASVSWIANNQDRVHLFRPKSNVDAENIIGSHAKFCITDRKIAYIGSANLTFLGLHRHLEMGVLLQGEVVKQVFDFWQLLINNQFLIEEKNL